MYCVPCGVRLSRTQHGTPIRRTWYPKGRSFLLLLKELKENAVLLSNELTSKNNETLLLHYHLFSRHQPEKVPFSQCGQQKYML